MAASGYVRFATEKNELCPRSIRNAHRERKYNPIPEVLPANTITHTPVKTPMADIAAGMANIPAPSVSTCTKLEPRTQYGVGKVNDTAAETSLAPLCRAFLAQVTWRRCACAGMRP